MAKHRPNRELGFDSLLLDTIFDWLPGWVAVKDVELRYLRVNRNYLRDAGADLSDFIGKRVLERPIGTPEENLALFRMEQWVHDAGKTVTVRENTATMPDGSVRYLRSTRLPILDDAGISHGLLSIAEDLTAQRWRERELLSHSQHLDDVVETTDAIIWDFDLATRTFTYVSPQAERISGQPPEAWTVLESWSHLIHPEDRDAAVGQRTACMERGEDHELRYRMLLPDGRTVWVRDSARMQREHERPVRMRGVMVDITAQRQADLDSARSRQLLRAIIDSIPAWLSLKDEQGRYLMVNRMRLDMVGMDESRLLGKTTLEQPYGTFEERYKSHLLDQEALNSGKVVHRSNASLMLPDGRVRYFDTTARPLDLPDEGGRRVLVLATDVSERKDAEDAIRRSEARYRVLVEGSLQGIVVHRGFQPLFVNRVFAEMFGYTVDELMAFETLEPLIPSPAERAEIRSITEAHLADPASQSRAKVRRVRKDGSTLVLECLRSTVEWDDQPAMLVTVIDVTEREALEERLRRVEKFRAVGELAGGIAHDLNNILQPIALLSKLLLDKFGKDDNARRMLEVIAKSEQRARDLISKILVFGQRADFRPQVCNPREIVQEALALLSTIPKSVVLKVSVADDVPNILADFGQIEDVVINLCVNAAQAMNQSGRIEIRIAAASPGEARWFHGGRVEGDSFVRISVIDDGPGFDTAIVSQMFEPFWSTKPQGEGAGLGLSLVLGVVQRHAGCIDVESRPGEGARFDVYLPSADRPPAQREEPVAPTVDLHGEGHLLVVDDEALVADTIATVLREYGYTVTTVTDGPSALEVLRSRPEDFVLIITDQTMPGLSGEELLGRIREIELNTPVIIVSGYSDTINRERAERIGASAFVQKPVGARELASIVKTVLVERHA